MIRITIRGYACVCCPGPDGDTWEVVTDPDVLRTLDGLVADDETFTDYLGPAGSHPTPEKLALAAALEPGGVITFGHRDGEPLLTATTEYRSPRPLSAAELRALVEYTMGQWSDGIGDNLFQNPIHPEYNFECLWSREVVLRRCPGARVGAEYPLVEVTEG